MFMELDMKWHKRTRTWTDDEFYYTWIIYLWAVVSNYFMLYFPKCDIKKCLASLLEAVLNEDQICWIWNPQNLWKESDRKELIVHPIYSSFWLQQQNNGYTTTLSLPNVSTAPQPKGVTLFKTTEFFQHVNSVTALRNVLSCTRQFSSYFFP